MVNSMVSNMAVGPVMVGGNEVSVTPKGKVRVVNGNGKVLTLSQDQFQKQTLRNLDRLENGENVEYKKDNKALKIIGATVAVAGLTLAIINRKKIANYLKDFSFKKAWKDFKNLFKGKAKPSTIGGTTSGQMTIARNAAEQAVANETRAIKNTCEAARANQIIENVERLKVAETGAEHAAKQALYDKLFGGVGA